MLSKYFLLINVLKVKVIQIWEVFTCFVQLRNSWQNSFVIEDANQFMRKHAVRKWQKPKILTDLRKLIENFLILRKFEIQYHIDHYMKLWQYLNNIFRIILYQFLLKVNNINSQSVKQYSSIFLRNNSYQLKDQIIGINGR